MKTHRRIIDFLGLRRSVVALLTMVILVGMGEKLGERFLPIYILALGGSAYVIGLLSGLDNLLSALYSFPGGYLSEKSGTSVPSPYSTWCRCSVTSSSSRSPRGRR